MSLDEQSMPGGVGNAGAVVRSGDTVRRPAGPQTPAVAAFLHHLEARGFDGAPRHLGYDERGREVVTYVEGDVSVHDDIPGWALTDEALVSVAELTRRLNDAALGFTPPPDAHWVWPPHPDHRTDLVCHNDPCRENVVFRDGRATALIDFDFAGPSSRAWEMAGLVRHWVLALPGDRVARFGIACAAYGIHPADVVDALLVRMDWGIEMVRARAMAGEPGFVMMWENGVYERNRVLRDWARDNRSLLAQRLDG